MSTLEVTHDQVFWDDRQLAALRSLGLENTPKPDLALFLAYCQKTGLDPFSRQIYCIGRGGRWTIQASIDGLRIVAQRSGEYAGQTPPMWCGSDGVWVDVWLSDQAPSAAKIGVYRQGFSEALMAVATYDSYAARNKDGNPQGLWKQMPDVMLAKVAEALALRKAFPNDLSGIYSSEEMDQADVKVTAQKVEQAVNVVKEIASKKIDVPTDTEIVQATAVIHGVYALETPTKDQLKEWWDKADGLGILDVVVDGEMVRQVITDALIDVEEIAS